MNGKFFLSAIIMFLSVAAYGQELTKAQIDAAYRQTKIESIVFKVTGFAGVGLVTGLSLNALLKELNNELSKAPGLGNQSNFNNKILKTSLGSLLAIGSLPLVSIGLMNAYYASRYGVSFKVADAARLTLRPLSLPLIKQMFLDAEKKDGEKLRSSLSKALELEMGNNWQQQLKEKLKSSDNIFDKALYLISVLENLYSSRLYTGGSVEPSEIKINAQKLLKSLNIFSIE